MGRVEKENKDQTTEYDLDKMTIKSTGLETTKRGKVYSNKKEIVEIKNIYFDASVKFNISLGRKGKC